MGLYETRGVMLPESGLHVRAVHLKSGHFSGLNTANGTMTYLAESVLYGCLAGFF